MNQRPRSKKRTRRATADGSNESHLARRDAQFRAITAVATAISEQPGLIQLLNSALDAILEATEMSCGYAHLLDEDEQTFLPITHRGIDSVEADRYFSVGEVIARRASEIGELDVTAVAGGGISGLVVVPLIARGRVRGALSFRQSEHRLIDDQEKEMLNIIGLQLGVALEQSRLLERRLIHQERIAAVGELAAGIAHEIGTPLNIISANVEYLLRQQHSWTYGEFRRDGRDGELIAIRDQVHNITRLIRQLLNFARDQSPAFEQLDINELIERTLELLAHRLNQARIQCETSLAVDAPSVNGDAVQLQQVLFNLIGNARQAIEESEQGSGLLSISTASSPVPTDECPRPHVIITIADDGPGIPPEILPQVFKPFFTANKEGGTGLGLSICQQIVQRHFGSLTIENARPHGAIVKIYLPESED